VKQPKYDTNKAFLDAINGLLSQNEWRLAFKVTIVQFQTIQMLKAKLRYQRRWARVDKKSKALAEDLRVFAFKQEIDIVSDHDPSKD